MDDRVLISDDETFIRMSLAERVQHFILIGTFIVLMLSGLPVFFSGFKAFHWLISSARAFALRGLVHRAAAVLLIADLLWMLLYALLARRGRQMFAAMIPRAKDLRDAFEQFFHNLGVTRLMARLGVFKRFFARHPYWLFDAAPRFDRYGFAEKFEYWSVAWGSAVMVASGFFMWDFQLSLRLFPLWVHDAFIIVHSYEAILAFLAIIIWHMYNVHLNPEDFPMSWTWLNGRITGEELRLLHPLEYERLLEERRRALARRNRAEGV